MDIVYWVLQRPLVNFLIRGFCWVFGPICFIIFINYLDEVLNLVDGFVYKFADDTKYGRVIRDDGDREIMQNDIYKLME